MVLGATLIALLVVGFFWSKAPHRELVYWMMLIFLSAVLRAAVFASFNTQADSTPSEDEEKSVESSGSGPWGALFWVTSMFAGSIWGFFPLIFHTYLSSEHLLLISAIYAGMVAIAASAGNIYPASFYAFALPLVVPLVLVELFSEKDVLFVTGVMLVLYLLVNALMVKRGHRQFQALVFARYENESLMSRLSVEKEVAIQAVEIKNRFLASASHDLRQPLHALGMFIGSLKNRENDSERLEIISDMETSTEALGKLLHGLLDLSRLEAGVVSPEVSSVSLREILNGLRVEYLQETKVKKIELRFTSEDLNLLTDNLLLERILRNLLTNAVAHTQAGKVEVYVQQNNQYEIDLVVSDTGIGIPESERSNIFREYYQLPGKALGPDELSNDVLPASGQDRGLGLGLSIVKRLCELLEMPIRVKDRIPTGTEFILTVPLADQPVEPRHLTAIDSINLAGRVILIVDDEPMVVAALSRLLEDWGGKVLVAETASSALFQIAQCSTDIDAMLCDYRLPQGRSGLDLVAALREATGRSIPAIVISADTTPGVLKNVANSGLPLLSKPVTGRAISEALVQVLTD